MKTLDQFETILRSGDYETPAECRPAHPLPRGFRAWWRFYVSGVLRTLFSTPAADLCRNHTQRAFSAMSFRMIQCVESTGAMVSVEGTGKLAQAGDMPRVFVANHSSLLETFHLPSILGVFGPLTIVAKRSLAKYPVFGKCLRAVDPILLDRKSARHDLAETLAQGKRLLASGRSVLLFPQGTRTSVFDPRKFNSLGAKLAREAGVALVPIACKTDFAVPGRLAKDIGPIDPSKPVRYAIGPALPPDLPQAELQKASTDFISKTLERWAAAGTASSETSGRPTPPKFSIFRVFSVAARRFVRHRSSLHAAGLTYFSLMSLAPAICLALLFARMCGLGDFARDRLNDYIDTVIVSVEKGGDDMPSFIESAQNEESREARRQTAHDFAIQARKSINSIFDRIVAYDVHAMGTVGILMLLWTVVSMLGMVENSLNEIWEIPKSRPFLRKIPIYTAMAFVLPAFALISASMPILHLLRRTIAWAFDSVGLEGWIPSLTLAVVNSKVFGWSISLVFATLGFACFLGFMPNRRIPFRVAVRSGLVTALIFGCWLKLCAIAQIGISRASAMYGSFAVLPILLTWICISWQIVLFGGAMTYAMSDVGGSLRQSGDIPGGK